MQGTQLGRGHATTFARVALVQFDYQPSALLVYPHIEEPTQLAEGEQGITSLHLSVTGVESQILSLRRDIAKEHEEFIRRRVCRILDRLNELSVDVVIFPEYSIPASCLSLIGESGEGCVVAASHTVTPDTVGICRNLGIEVDSSEVGKNICPIRLSRGNWDRVDKLTRSRWEGTLKPGSVWRPIRLRTSQGKDLLFAVFLCVDFLNELDPNLQRIVPRDLWHQVDFGVVPSYSPTLRDFEQRARPVAERAGRPIVYANVASIGGSRVYCHFGEMAAFTDRHGTKPLAPGDEAVVVVDLPLGPYAQFRHVPTPLPTPPTSELVSVLPLISKEKFVRYCDLRDNIRSTPGDEQKRNIAQAASSELLYLASLSDLPTVLKTKVFSLLEAVSWRDGQWIDSCIDCIPLAGDEASLDETRYALLYKAQRLLAGIVKDTRVRGIELEAVTGVLDVYRRGLDALRPRIPTDVAQKFEASDLAIHTVDRDPRSSTFTSVFVMRLRSARVHREALEKQIRLISTLAYHGNTHLALNLRYVSLPNPGGNLKDLDVIVLGAAKADEPSHSREMADNFRRDLANLMRVTLRDAYLFRLQELETVDLSRVTEPFSFNHIAEIHRKVDFGIQPYVDQQSAPKIHHLEGSSSLARVLDTLQSSPFACLVSMHLHPIALTEAEEAFFRTYRRASQYRPEVSEAAMFYLGTERHPALRLSDAVTMRRMLGDTEGLRPNLMVRMFVASDQPLSRLLLNTIGTELWGNDSYVIKEFGEDQDELEAAANTLQRSWVTAKPPYKTTPVKLERVPVLFDPYEASRLFRLPLEGHSGAVGTLFSVIPAPAAALPEDGIEIGIGFHSGAQKPIVVRLSEEERGKHVYVVGKTGTGKSTLLGRMIEQDIRAGRGVCVIDPHGDLVESVLNRIPEIRISDVVLLDPAVTERPFGINLLEFNPTIPHHKDFVVQDTIAIMRKLFYHEHYGPMFEHNVRHLVLTMLDESMARKGTLLEVPRLLYDREFREAVVPRLKDELARDFWSEYQQVSPNTRSEFLYYVVSKFDTFTIDRIMRNIVGQADSTINIPDILEKKQILLVKLPSALIGELNAALLGMIIISKLRWAGMARAALPPSERENYYLYVDEFQNFAASGFETILAEARKFGLCLTLAHQHIAQLSAFNITTGNIEDRVAQAVFGNVGTMIAFRLGVNDAEFLGREMGEPVDPHDLENLKSYYAIVKTLIGGEVYAPFTIKTVLSQTPERPEIAEKIRQNSHEKYGMAKEEVEKQIKERTKQMIHATS